ncbi:T9SS type A sorting domain-containing protein [candidate division KSB1 bacterium]|nr:T9SS type A sorting domain-containing protein [candidate division KSB1 bacterium]
MKLDKLFLLILAIVLLIPIGSISQDHQSWSYNLGIYEVNVRQYTAAGTFAAFESHLPRLKEMGVGILWFMPIHPIGQQNRLGRLGSYYSVKDYYGVNPEFGTIDEFKALVEKIHDMGMYVIIDWVANHTAWDNLLTVSHPEWYSKDANGNFIPPPGTNWSDVIDLDYSKQGLRDYMIAAMKYWVDEINVDGFRCDAASMVPMDFWQTAISELKNDAPDIFILAEADGVQYHNAGFDMTFAWGLHGFGDGVLKRIVERWNNANSLANFVSSEQHTYPDSHYRMYFTSNHDENSWHGTVFEQFGDAAEPFAVLTCTLDGMPLIYSGQEAGLDKRLQFFDKDLIIWRDHPFTDMYTTLLHLKRENQSLWNGENGGDIQRVRTTSDNSIFAFIQEKEDEKTFAIFNLSPGYVGGTLQDSLYFGNYVDVFENDTVTFEAEANFGLQGWDYKVYEEVKTSTGINFISNQPAEFSLSQNYPNPFNPATTIRFEVPEPEHVTLKIYDLSGRLVATLINGSFEPGVHRVNLRADQFASGIYFYRLKAGGFSQTRKLTVLK